MNGRDRGEYSKMGTDVVDINIIKHGLTSKPPYVTLELEWVTDRGYELFSERQKELADFYEHDKEASVTALNYVKDTVSENIIFVDLGAGRSMKSINMMRALVKNHPDRKIFYIPNDVNETILEWDSYIKEFDIKDNIIDVKPVLCDMVEALSEIENIIKGPYEKWDVVFAAFGPISTHVTHQQLLDIVTKTSQFIKSRGKGAAVMSFVELTENTHDQWETCLNGMKTTEQLESVLLGLKDYGISDLETTQFNYIRKYEDNFTTPGISGHWSGCTYYAQAKEDMTLTFDHIKLKDVKLNLRKDELLRLSADVTCSHFYDVDFLKSLAKKNCVEMEWWQISQKYGLASVAFVPTK